MALKSIVDLDVSAFTKYQADFQKYQELLAKTPAAWTKVTKNIDASRKSFQELVAAAQARQGYAKLTASAEEAATRATEGQARHWRDMVRSTHAVAGNIIGATRALLRWAEITGVISGLLGAGGLFGIDRLAQSAAGQRRGAAGLGITPGEHTAFGLNYGRVIDTDSVLGGVNESLTNASKRGALYRAGLSEQDIAGKDAAQIAVTLTEHLQALAKRTDPRMLGNYVSIYGYDQLGFTVQDAQRLRARSTGELGDYGRAFSRDSRDLNLNDNQLRAWEDFKVQLNRAGASIEKTFVTELTPLAGPLGELSKAFTDLIKSLLGGEQGKNAIREIAIGLKEFGGFITSHEFKDDVKTFVEDVGKLAHGVHSILGFLFRDRPHTPESWGPSGLDPNADNPSQQDLDRGSDYWRNLLRNLIPSGPDSGFLGPTPGSGPGLLHPTAYRTGGGNPGQFGDIERANGLPAGLLNSIYGIESGYGRNVGPSSAGAIGPFQFLPNTFARYGTGNPWDLGDSSKAAGNYLAKLMGEFHGDIAKAVASYNWGEGNVERDVARYGDDWRSHVPAETRRYLDRALGGSGRLNPNASNVAIQIYNNTGGSAIVTASALG